MTCPQKCSWELAPHWLTSEATSNGVTSSRSQVELIMRVAENLTGAVCPQGVLHSPCLWCGCGRNDEKQ